ncbi:MAG: N-acetylmuramoyl-L-alanine amidase family protein [Saprospiraceae bacterium]
MQGSVVKFFFFLLFLAYSLAVHAKPVYLTVKVKEGEGVYALLRRFALDEFDCNVEKFYKINKLGENDPLMENQYYKVPVMIYTYNGKSIKSSIKTNDLLLAKKVEDYNKKMLRLKVKRQPLVKGSDIWVPYHELECKETEVEVKETNASKNAIPIFFNEETKVKKSKLLNGKVFYVDAGHGGPDPGAQSKGAKRTLCEDEYAYDVSIRLAKKLIENGATVYMTTRDPNDGIRNGDYLPCDRDEVHYPNTKMPVGQKARLTARANIINKLYKKHKKEGATVQRLICIHVDSRSKREQTDVFFYYKPGSDASENLAISMQNTFAFNYPKGRAYGGEVSRRDLFMLRETKPVSVYVELGNLKNERDLKRLLIVQNREALADWLYEGFIK